jgi:hypothetical protein
MDTASIVPIRGPDRCALSQLFKRAFILPTQVDPTSVVADVAEDERRPLWSRDAEGLRHIR